MCKFIAKRFTLVELLVVISVIAILAGILMPQLGNARLAANRTDANSAIRSIAQAAAAGTAMQRGSSFKGDWAVDIATLSTNLITPESGTYDLEVDLTSTFDDLNAIVIDHDATGSVASSSASASENAETIGALLEDVTSANEETYSQAGFKDAYSAFKSYREGHAFDTEFGFYYFSGKRWQTGEADGDWVSGSTPKVSSSSKKKSDTETRLVGESYPMGNGDDMAGIGYADTHVSMIKLSTSASGNTNTANPMVLNAIGEPSTAEAAE